MQNLEPESATDKVVRKTPWWGISAGLHLTLAMILGWIIVLQQPAETEEITVVRRSPPKPPPPIFEKHDDPSPVPLKIDKTFEHSELTRDPSDQTPESKDEDPRETLRGENEDHQTRNPFNSRNWQDVIGVNGSPSGRKGGPFGGIRNQRGGPRKGDGPTDQTEAAVERGLLWLARHQNPKGFWNVDGFQDQCKADRCSNPSTVDTQFDIGVTGLALLAFLGAGYSHLSRDVHEGIHFGLVVQKGLQWLLDQQRQDDGRIGEGNVYNHALATFALTEDYGLTGSILSKDATQKAIDWLAAAQNPGAGWRYAARNGESDSSVTGWCVMVFKSAHLAGFHFPESVYEGARAWFDDVTESDYHRVGYNRKGTGKVYCRHNQAFDHHESMAAISAMSRIFMDKNAGDPAVTGAASLLMRDLPKWETAAIDYYYWYYASLALFQLGGERFVKWNAALTTSLVKNQNLLSSGCRNGSWEPVDRWSCEAGRVYATAINVLTLEVYYRYPSVFGGSR